MKKIGFERAGIVLLVNAAFILVVVVGFSLILRGYFYFMVEPDRLVGTSEYDTNTIRATYPNYKELEEETALDIFVGYGEPKSEYLPYVQWRRMPYQNSAVTVEGEFRTRLSTGHSVEDSVWFLGGSTMWGTGATDSSTIPSFYSTTTGEKVWNLGESGFNSFQELVQLQVLLSNGHRPKAVVFYGGVNEAIYCDANNRLFPTHYRFEEYRKFVKSYYDLKRQLANALATIRNQNHVIDIWSVGASPFKWLISPYVKAYTAITDDRAIGRSVDVRLDIGGKFSEYSRKNYYKVCGEDAGRAESAGRSTVAAWLLAYNILEARDIPVAFILQPSAQIKPGSYYLDYMLASAKQAIADETASYSSRYEATRQAWNERCQVYDACAAFLDLSEIFVGRKEPIFIDPMHVSPNGNELIANAIVRHISNR